MEIIRKKHVLVLSILLTIFGRSVYAKEVTKLDCLVNPEMYIDISSPVPGILESILVKKTDSIKKGQPLAKLESSVEAAKVKVAHQATLLNNQIQAKRFKLAYARRKVKRIQGLYNEDASSAQEQDDAETELAIARTELAQAKLDKRTNELKLVQTKAELELKTIKSPINGIVVEQYSMPGESVDNQPILQLAKIDPLMVEVVAPASLFGLIKTGMKVEIKPDAPINSTYQAKVSMVDRIINAASGSFTIRLTLPNPDDKLIGGTKCMALFPIKSSKINNSFRKTSTNSNSADDALPEDIRLLLGE